MITMNWNEKNINSFEKKMNKLVVSVVKNTTIGLEEALKNIQATALKLKKGKSTEDLIPYVIIKDDNKLIVGRVYTDRTVFSYASFLEYGTGIYAEREHIGTTKTFIQSGYSYWFLPVDKADRDFGSDRIIVIKGEKFYIMYPQQPQPFMRPTAFQTRSETVDIIKTKLKQGIREVILR